MASSVNLGSKLESIVEDMVRSGRFNSRSEVLREGVRMIHERESRLAALDASIAEALADVEAGRVHDLDDVAREMKERYSRPGRARSA